MNKTNHGTEALPSAVVKPYAVKDKPPLGAIRVDTYKAYHKIIKKWQTGALDDTLIIIGSAGIGKSEQAIRAMSSTNHCYLKGQATRYGVYLQLFEHLNEPVILDDVDSLLANKEVTGLLKMLLETRSPRTIQWTTGATLNPDSGIPSNFATRSRTMILANELNVISKNFSAVMDRSTILWFCPSAAEIHRYVGTWFDLKKSKDVYEYVGERIHATPSPSCRFYYHAAKWKKAELPWKKMIDEQMMPTESKALLVKLLDTKYTKARERVNAWKEETGESEQAYWATKKAVDLKSGKTSKRGAAISEAMKRHHAARKAAKAEAAGAAGMEAATATL